MRWFDKFSYWLKSLFRKGTLDAQLSEEIQTHVDMVTEANIAAGMSPREARYAAMKEFGGVEQIKERTRDERGWRWLEETWQDLGYAVRMMRKTPVATVTAVLTLALGIGVNAALFAVFDFIVLQPLPSHRPEELVDIQGHNEQVQGRVSKRFSYPDYLDYTEGTQAFSSIAAMTTTNVILADDAQPAIGTIQDLRTTTLALQAVSKNYFSTLGAKVVLGRDFLQTEASSYSGKPVIVISHLFWQTHLRGDDDVLGSTLSTQDPNGTGNEITYTIIGVTAPEFLGQSTTPPAGWIPLSIDPTALDDRTQSLVFMIGRMSAGVSPLQAKADLDAIALRLSERFPGERRPTSIQLTPGMMLVSPDQLSQVILPMSPILLGFGLTLVIACLNVANLLLARGVTRQHEIGVRLTLGASRGRIVRQLMAENFLLCGLGAMAALLLALWTLQTVQPIMLAGVADIPGAKNFVSRIEIGLDGHIIGFSALLALVAGLTAGLAPALHSVRRDVLFSLKHEGSAFGQKVTPSRLRSLLLVGQIAICLTLLGVSGLITGRLVNTDIADSGVAVKGVYQMRAAATNVVGTVLANNPLNAVETLRTIPGVASACLVSETPMRKGGDNFREMRVKVDDDYSHGIHYSQVSAGFFETVGISLLRGRTFTPGEVAATAPFVIVSETAAQRLWPNQEAIGKIVTIDSLSVGGGNGRLVALPNQDFRDYEVIGVAPGIRNNWSTNDQKQLLWFPLPAEGASGTILVKLETDSASVIRGVERMATAADVPLKFAEKLETIVNRSLWPFRTFAQFSAVLSGLALIMATVGLYGVVSFGVNQRVKEIGVRMALGATAERVTRLFVRQNMRLVAWGVALGLVASAAFASLLGNVMPGAGFAGGLAFRCIVLTLVTAFLVSVALIASWLPARRAAKVDPMLALRAE